MALRTKHKPLLYFASRVWALELIPSFALYRGLYEYVFSPCPVAHDHCVLFLSAEAPSPFRLSAGLLNTRFCTAMGCGRKLSYLGEFCVMMADAAESNAHRPVAE